MFQNTAASIGIFIVLGLFGNSLAVGQAPPAAVRFEQIEEVVSGFQESQHLYVQGEMGVSPEQLAALEAWLDTNGPHWTVVLMQRGANQLYTAPDGRAFTGLDAVEFALGHGLANRTSFGRLEHPKTGETDGAAFVLFLEDRKFSYYASDAQDRRGIGEAQWIGNLDRNARVAMQNGGRIIDAVKDTVNDINGRLAQSIANEEQAERERVAQAERIQRERQRAVAQVRADIEATRMKLLPEVEAFAANFLKDFPEANASLMARPPISSWKSDLNRAENALNEDNSREVSQTVTTTIADIHRQLDYYGAHTAFEQTLAPLQQRWQGLTLHRYSSAAESHAIAAQQLLRRARTEHLSGNPSFITLTDEVRKSLDLGDAEINRAIQKAEQNVARKQLIRRTILATLGIVFVASASLLLFLHRRRRPALAAAKKLLSDSQEKLQKEQASIDTVSARKKTLIGTLEGFTKRGKTGETLLLAQAIQAACDGIEKMANSAKQHVAQVDGFINPTDPWGQVINFFSPTRYLEGRNRLASKALFDTAANSATTDLTAVAVPQSMTLDDFLAEMVKRRTEAEQTLDHLEHCSRAAIPSLDNLSDKFTILDQQSRALANNSKQDGYFKLLHLEAKLLPSILRLIELGRKMAEIDPVSVVKELGPEAQRQIEDATDGIAFVNEVRGQHFPIFDAAGDKLESLKHRTQWIEEHVFAIGDRLNQLMQDSCEHGIEQALRQLKVDASAFLTKLRSIVQTAESTIPSRLNEVNVVRQALSTARVDVAKSLSIQVSQAISEESLNPDDHLRSAESAIHATRVAIDLGSLDDAVRAANAAEEETRYAQSLVDGSLQSLKEFSSQNARIKNDLDATMVALEKVTKVVETAEQTYAPTALIWHDESDEGKDLKGDQDDQDAWETESYATGEPIAMQVESTNRIIDSVRSGIEAVPAKHAEGKLLEAANAVRFAAEGMSEANKRIRLAANHCKRIEALVPANILRAESLLSEVVKQKVHIEDARAEISTQQAFESLQSVLKQMTDELKLSRIGRDPFEDANELIKQKIAVVELRSLIKVDFAAFAEAKLAVEGARRELKAAATLAMQSIEDQVPDSAEIARCQDAIRRLSPVVTSIETDLKVAHNDWQTIQVKATDATAELGVISGSLRQELRAAQEAALGIRTASSEVLRASRWTGAYGITVSGQPGSQELEAARNSFASGDYAGTIALSGRSVRAVVEAMEAAEEAVRSRRRQEEVAAARRRAREESLLNSSRSSSFGGSSFGSSRSSWSSSSSSRSSFSSSSSSSSRSSGGSSGFSRSGW